MNRSELVDKVARQLRGSQFDVVHERDSSRIHVAPSPGAQFYVEITVDSALRSEIRFLAGGKQGGGGGTCLIRAHYRGDEAGHGPTSLFFLLMHTALLISTRTRIVEGPLLVVLWSRSWEVEATTFWNPKIHRWGFPWSEDAPRRWPAARNVYDSPARSPLPPRQTAAGATS